VRDHERHSSSVVILALDKTAAIAAAARALADGFVNKAVLNTQGIRFADAASIYSPWFQPGGAKFGDVSGLLRLGNGALWNNGAAAAKQTPIEAVLAE
jgi:hypothetical protein